MESKDNPEINLSCSTIDCCGGDALRLMFVEQELATK